MFAKPVTLRLPTLALPVALNVVIVAVVNTALLAPILPTLALPVAVIIPVALKFATLAFTETFIVLAFKVNTPLITPPTPLPTITLLLLIVILFAALALN